MRPQKPSLGALDHHGAPPARGTGLRRWMGSRLGGDGGTDWLNRLFGVALLVGVGVILGINYLAPDKRMIAVMGATLLFGIAWRIDPVSAVGVLVIALPYPRGTVFGSTNVAMVLLLALIWMLRVSTRQLAPARRTPVDAPIIALLIAFTVSFYNIETQLNLVRALENYVQILAGFAMFYLVVNNLHRPEHLERVHVFQCISIAMVCLLGIFELTHPDAVLIPGWIVRARGSLVGSGGFIVIGDNASAVDCLLNLAHFYNHESCGQCTPCREGCGWIEQLVHKILSGKGTQGDLETILRVSDLMAGKTICALADAMAWPAVAFIKKYPQEFAALCAEPVDMGALAAAVGKVDHILPKAS